jgi:hypothetical protein
MLCNVFVVNELFLYKFHRAQTSAGCARKVLRVLGASLTPMLPAAASSFWQAIKSSEEAVRTLSTYGGLVQVVRTTACHAGGRGFESRRSRQLSTVKNGRRLGRYHDFPRARDLGAVDSIVSEKLG